MLYNVTWETSETKKIYQATRESEILMSYLEENLVKSDLVKLIGEHPVLEKGREYGVMVYYYKAKPKRRLLSAAPRRNNSHIHIVLFSRILSKSDLMSHNFDLGNNSDDQPDIKVKSVEEIKVLIDLLKKKIQVI